MMIYQSEQKVDIPQVDLLTFLFDHDFSTSTEDTVLHAEAHDPSYTLTKAQTRALTKQFAHFLRASYGIGADGAGKDVVVSCCLGQSALSALFYGVIAAGGIFSGASAASTPTELARQAKDGSARVIVCSEQVRLSVLKAAREAGLDETCVLVLKSYPSVSLESSDGRKRCDFQHSLEWEVIRDPKTLAQRTACILYSSGTTGLPKGVKMSHTNLVSQAVLSLSVSRRVTQHPDQKSKYRNQRTIGHLPTAHVAGIQGYFVHPIVEGTTIYWMPAFKFDDFIRYCRDLKITGFFSVPPIWMAIAKHPAVTDHFASVNAAMSGAAPLSKELQIAVARKLGSGNGEAPLRQTWGLSETGGSVTYAAPDFQDESGSLGPLIPNTYMRLIDDDGKDVKPGEAGEALMKGPIVTPGYHNRDQVNKEAFTSDGWFRTGDILRVENGLLYLVDRKKELIKYKGLQVAPAELENILIAHPSVTDAAVIGITLPDGNEVPRAYVVRSPPPANESPISAEELAEYVKGQVSPYKQLRGGVVFVENVPRSPSGKILRKDLRDMVKREQQGEKAKL